MALLLTHGAWDAYLHGLITHRVLLGQAWIPLFNQGIEMVNNMA
jgi:hypothetical protein